MGFIKIYARTLIARNILVLVVGILELINKEFQYCNNQVNASYTFNYIYKLHETRNACTCLPLSQRCTLKCVSVSFWIAAFFFCSRLHLQLYRRRHRFYRRPFAAQRCARDERSTQKQGDLLLSEQRQQQTRRFEILETDGSHEQHTRFKTLDIDPS